jgi:hypothetical protein
LSWSRERRSDSKALVWSPKTNTWEVDAEASILKI